MEYRPWQFNTNVRTYVHKYVGTLALLENVVVLALKRVPVLLVEVTRSGRVCGGSCPGCSEERTSNVAWVPTTLQEQGRIGECGESSCQPSLGTVARTTS